ncbi:MAG: hypothetical protein HY909_05305 [Deltaproteobacteria bacterium]|nr:hypothetical protein [Deltaproteobacteria bacterium]
MPVTREKDRHGVFPLLGALSEALLDVLDLLSAAGEERDDRPRVYAQALVRWVDGALTPAALGAARRGLDEEAWRLRAPEENARPWARLEHASNALAAGRGRLMQYPTHAAMVAPRVLAVLASALEALGEETQAARGRVWQLFSARYQRRAGALPAEAWRGPEPPSRHRLSG